MLFRSVSQSRYARRGRSNSSRSARYGSRNSKRSRNGNQTTRKRNGATSGSNSKPNRPKLLWEALGFLIDDICRMFYIIRVPLILIWGVSIISSAALTCSLIQLYFQGKGLPAVWTLIFPGYLGLHVVVLILWWFKCCINRAKARLQ